MKVSNNIAANPNLIDSAKSKSSDKVDLSGAAKGKEAKSAKSLEGSAKVNVSERAQMMQKAKNIASQDTVDDAKVARLQKLIDAGEYKVNAEAIADRLVDDHMLFNN